MEIRAMIPKREGICQMMLKCALYVYKTAKRVSRCMCECIRCICSISICNCIKDVFLQGVLQNPTHVISQYIYEDTLYFQFQQCGWHKEGNYLWIEK